MIFFPITQSDSVVKISKVLNCVLLTSVNDVDALISIVTTPLTRRQPHLDIAAADASKLKSTLENGFV